MQDLLFALLGLLLLVTAQPIASADVKYEELPPLSTVITKMKQAQEYSLIERMRSNTLSSGAGFRDDELIQSDLRTCRNVLAALSES